MDHPRVPHLVHDSGVRNTYHHDAHEHSSSQMSGQLFTSTPVWYTTTQRLKEPTTSTGKAPHVRDTVDTFFQESRTKQALMYHWASSAADLCIALLPGKF
jgi:hypothetical protein